MRCSKDTCNTSFSRQFWLWWLVNVSIALVSITKAVWPKITKKHHVFHTAEVVVNLSFLEKFPIPTLAESILTLPREVNMHVEICRWHFFFMWGSKSIFYARSFGTENFCGLKVNQNNLEGLSFSSNVQVFAGWQPQAT